MAINEYMMELLEEMVNPDEIALNIQVENAINEQDDALFGIAELDDDLIEWIDSGEKFGYEDPVDFSEE